MLQNGCFIASLHFWAPGRKEKSVFLLSLLPSFLLSLPPSFLPPSLPPFLPSSLPSFLPSFFLALPPSPSFLPHPSLSLFVLLTFKKTVAFLETAPRTSAYILLSSIWSHSLPQVQGSLSRCPFRLIGKPPKMGSRWQRRMREGLFSSKVLNPMQYRFVCHCC